MLESLILGMILDQERTGYDIKKCISERFSIFYKASFGSLYPALNRLVGKGLVTTREETKGARKKIFYLVTEEGRNEFLGWLCSPMEIMDGTNLKLIKVYFFDQLPRDVRDEQLTVYEKNNNLYLQKLLALEQTLKEVDQAKHYYKLSTLYYGIIITQRTIEWCQHIREGKLLSDLVEEKGRRNGYD